MGRVRLTRPVRARVAYFVGLAVFCAGIYLVDGLGWALMLAGAGIAFWALALYDVDEPEKPFRESRARELGPGPLDEWREQP